MFFKAEEDHNAVCSILVKKKKQKTKNIAVSDSSSIDSLEGTVTA